MIFCDQILENLTTDYPDRIKIFWLIRIRTQEKNPIRIRTKGPGSETLL